MRYVLTDEFQEIQETSGVIVNISNVNIEISDTPEHGTGVILFPKHPFPFSKKVYACRAGGSMGTAIIAVSSAGSLSVDSENSDGNGCCCDDVPTFKELKSIVEGEYPPDSEVPTLEELSLIVSGIYKPNDKDNEDSDDDIVASPEQIQNIIEDLYKG